MYEHKNFVFVLEYEEDDRDLQIPSNLSKLLTFFNSAICVRVDSQQFPKCQQFGSGRTCTFIRDVVGGHTCAPDRSGPRAWHVYLHSWRGRRVRMCSGPRRGKIVSNLTWRMLRFSAICQIASNLNCWQFQTNCWELPNSQQFQTGRDFWRSNCQHFPGPNCQQFDKLLGIWRSLLAIETQRLAHCLI